GGLRDALRAGDHRTAARLPARGGAPLPRGQEGALPLLAPGGAGRLRFPESRPMRGNALALISALGVAGCASAGPTPVAGVARELRQRGVDPAATVVPFELNDEMRAWVHARVTDGGSPEQRL